MFLYVPFFSTGQVELENLPLKKEALRQAGLPIQIKAGFIGKVKLQIPIRQIRTAPWVILIEKLYLVAGPVNLDEVVIPVVFFYDYCYVIASYFSLHI